MATPAYNAKVPIGSASGAPVLATREFLLYLQGLLGGVRELVTQTTDHTLRVRVDGIDERLAVAEGQIELLLSADETLRRDVDELREATRWHELDDEQGRALLDHNGEELLA